jgi:hypothetical protein
MTPDTELIGVAVKDGYLSVTLPPYESAHRMEAQIAAIYDAVQKHKAQRLFIDCRATRRLVPVVDLYELCVYMASTLGPSRPRIAAVISPEASYPDRFGENVLRNRGLDFIRFLGDEESALDWLLAGGPATPP